MDALVVLGAGLAGDRPSATATARVRRAAALYRAAGEPKPVVVVTGGRPPRGARTEAAAMAEALAGLGVAAGDVVREDTATSTAENLSRSAALLDGRAGDVVVVTSGVHRWRVRLLARGLGLPWRVSGAPAPWAGRVRAGLREARLLAGRLLTRAGDQRGRPGAGPADPSPWR